MNFFFSFYLHPRLFISHCASLVTSIKKITCEQSDDFISTFQPFTVIFLIHVFLLFFSSSCWLLPSSYSTLLHLMCKSPTLLLRSLLPGSSKRSVLLIQSLSTHTPTAQSVWLYLQNIECILSLWYSCVIYRKLFLFLFFFFHARLLRCTYRGPRVWRLRAKTQVINSCCWKFAPPNPAGCLSSAHLKPQET